MIFENLQNIGWEMGRYCSEYSWYDIHDFTVHVLFFFQLQDWSLINITNWTLLPDSLTVVDFICQRREVTVLRKWNPVECHISTSTQCTAHKLDSVTQCIANSGPMGQLGPSTAFPKLCDSPIFEKAPPYSRFPNDTIWPPKITKCTSFSTLESKLYLLVTFSFNSVVGVGRISVWSN